MKLMDLRNVAVVVVILLFIWAGTLDRQDAEVQESMYIDNVCMWQAQVASGVPEIRADGHPNYEKIEVNCK